MRCLWLILALLLASAGCNEERPEEDPMVGEAKKRIAKVDGAVKDLEARIDERAKANGSKEDDKIFPIVKATETCGPSKITVIYNPYRDVLIVKPGSVGMLADFPVELQLSGNVADKPVRKTALPDTLSALAGWRGASFMVKEVSAKKGVDAGKVGTLALLAITDAAKKIDDKTFTYVKSRHEWKVEVTIFDEDMRKKILDHSKKYRRTRAAVDVVSKLNRELSGVTPGAEAEHQAVKDKLNELGKKYRAELKSLERYPLNEHTAMKLSGSGKCN